MGHVGQVYDAADAAELLNQEATAAYGDELLESLGMLDKNLGAAVQTASGDAAAAVEHGAAVYNEARMAAQLEVGKELSGLGADMAAFLPCWH